MDILDSSPPEIGIIILSNLSANDLWSCLSVNARWRSLANVDLLWKKHLSECDIDPDQIQEVQGAVNGFDLCPAAKEWLLVQQTLFNWKHEKFKKIRFPVNLRGPMFYSCGNALAILERTMKIKTFSLAEDSLVLTSIINLPFETCISLVKEAGDLIISKDYLMYKNGNISIVFKKDSGVQGVTGYSLQLIIHINNEGHVDFLNKSCFKVLQRFVSDYISYDFSYLYKDKFWTTFYTGVTEYHYCINLESATVKRVIPRVSDPVYQCNGAKDLMILEYETKIAVCDLDGNNLFVKEYKNYLSLSYNGKLLAVFTPEHIYVVDLVTGSDLFTILNEIYLPQHLYIHPVSDIVYTSAFYLTTMRVCAHFNSEGKVKKLWDTTIKIDSERVIGKFKFIYGTYLVILMESPASSSDRKSLSYRHLVYFLNSRTGKVVHKQSIKTLVHFKQYFYIEGQKDFTLFKAI